MTVSAFDSRFFTLSCPKCKVIVELTLRQLYDLSEYECATCKYPFQLMEQPYKEALAHEFKVAEALDQANSF